MSHLFVSFTPYHALLSWGLALTVRPEPAHLALVADFVGAETLARAIRGFVGSPFGICQLIPGTYAKSLLYRRLTLAANTLAIRRMVSRSRPTFTYVFNDARPEAQAALHLSRTAFASVGVYVEDGAAAYSSFVAPRRSWLRRAAGRLIYGVWWRDVTVLGTSPWIDRVITLSPKNTRWELHRKVLTAFPRDSLSHPITKAMLHKYLDLSGWELQETNIDALILVAHSETVGDRESYARSLKEVIRYCKRNGFRVGIKYHPRETKDDYLCLGSMALLLPRCVPVETLYLLAAQHVRVVIGDQSTSLLTAVQLLPNAVVLSLRDLVKRPDWLYQKALESQGVLTFTSYSEVEPLLSTIRKGGPARVGGFDGRERQ